MMRHGRYTMYMIAGGGGGGVTEIGEKRISCTKIVRKETEGISDVYRAGSHDFRGCERCTSANLATHV
ncbi:hypothetical protein X777_14351 [Ooceraea biroi]|uniref:Uncharacterized protein n=1 Tax=Ooceraea biroi TaxID=2015173 RepID=A0A026WXA6_OOCBI|nr:hypothetical protein X777_14351 [Ooceraea biroi]